MGVEEAASFYMNPPDSGEVDLSLILNHSCTLHLPLAAGQSLWRVMHNISKRVPDSAASE